MCVGFYPVFEGSKFRFQIEGCGEPVHCVVLLLKITVCYYPTMITVCYYPNMITVCYYLT